jgi:hypothetical protein
MDEVQKPVVPSVIHHRQNPLESICDSDVYNILLLFESQFGINIKV